MGNYTCSYLCFLQPVLMQTHFWYVFQCKSVVNDTLANRATHFQPFESMAMPFFSCASVSYGTGQQACQEIACGCAVRNAGSTRKHSGARQYWRSSPQAAHIRHVWKLQSWVTWASSTPICGRWCPSGAHTCVKVDCICCGTCLDKWYSKCCCPQVHSQWLHATKRQSVCSKAWVWCHVFVNLSFSSTVRLPSQQKGA